MAGNIQKRPNGQWRARFRDDIGREHARHFNRKLDATRWLATVQADMLRGTYVDPGAGRRTFRDYAEHWRSVQSHRPSTAALVETHLRRHAYPILGGRPLGGVRPTDVRGLVRGLSESLAPATVEVVYRYVAAVFRAAAADRLIISSPCVGVRLPSRPPRRITPRSSADVFALTSAMAPRYRALVPLGAGTGLRQGEAFAVEASHVDWLRRSLLVCQQLLLMPGSDPVIAPLKTSASYRTIPLPGVVVDALAVHMAEFPPVDVEMTDITSGTLSTHRTATLLFATPAGRPLRRTSFSAAAWVPAREAACLPAGVTYHDLRHYYASLLIRHGESVKVVQARLGHATAAETLDTYAHLWPDSEDRTRAAVDEVLGHGGADSVRTEGVS